MDLPLSWHTDLAVLRLEGSTIDERPDHLVVRTPANPLYYWGNFVLVTDPGRVDEPEHWLDVFETEHPEAAHRSIGLVTRPTDAASWQALDLELTHDDVLVAQTCPEPTPVPQGYLVKQIADAIEWEQSTGLRITRGRRCPTRVSSPGSAPSTATGWWPSSASSTAVRASPVTRASSPAPSTAGAVWPATSSASRRSGPRSAGPVAG
jgi:hypothetical protein